MHDEQILWGIFVLLGLATILPRSSFIVLQERVLLPPIVQRALRYAPAAALSAIIAPDVFVVQGVLHLWSPKLAAAAVVIVSTLLSRNPWIPFIAGMGVLTLLTHFLGFKI